MKNKISIITASVLIANSGFAQTLQDAITKTDNERYEAASSEFKSLIAKEATKGENYFYYGENFFKKGDLDSANIYYQKGADVNATYPLNYVGLGKVLWYNGKSAEAKTQLFKAATLGNKKNAEVLRKTAEAYIYSENKNVDEAIALLNDAIKLDPKNSEAYLLKGDALLEKNPTDGGPAIKEYNKATELNPKSAKGILRQGKLYQRGRNFQLALEKYKEAEAIDPTYAPAYREKAELYHLAGQKNNAIEAYKKYLELNNSADARKRYAEFLFNNKQYAEAISEIENLQKQGNTSMFLDRYLGHSYAELGDKTDKDAYTKGLASITKFFDKAGANFKYLPLDFKYKGILLAKTGKDSIGVIEMQKAAAMDAKLAPEMNSLIASTWYKSKKYSKAIDAFNSKMAGDSTKLGTQDYFDLGRAYYYEGANKQREKKDAEALSMFSKSDYSFAKVTRLSETYAVAYFWRGKACLQQDLKNEKWLAKPHFEKALSLVKPEERAGVKANVIEACEYLGYNCLVNKDNAKAKEYFTTIKDLDANNKKQIDFFKSPAGK